MSWNPNYPNDTQPYGMMVQQPTQFTWDNNQLNNLGSTGTQTPTSDWLGTAGLGIKGLQTIGDLWGAFQANKLAKDQLNFTKNIANKNLANQTASYNTALEDRARSRAVAEGQTSAESQAYIDKNKLSV